LPPFLSDDEKERGAIMAMSIDGSGFSAIGSASPEQLRSVAEAFASANVPALLASHFQSQGQTPSVTDGGPIRGGMPLSPPNGASLTPLQLASSMRSLTSTASQLGGGQQWAQAIRDGLQSALSPGGASGSTDAANGRVSHIRSGGIQTGASPRNRVQHQGADWFRGPSTTGLDQVGTMMSAAADYASLTTDAAAGRVIA
jgi:hypothetical protein